eukprot:SAG11_NODE_1564_length_4675_cov_2.781687_6_plen_80_part_00
MIRTGQRCGDLGGAHRPASVDIILKTYVPYRGGGLGGINRRNEIEKGALGDRHGVRGTAASYLVAVPWGGGRATDQVAL